MSSPFDDIVSVFENLSAEPKDVKLSQWLAACVKGGKFKNRVLEYRQTGASEIKTNLPLITPGARCEGGRKRENVKHKTGWICLDIDDKDNTHLPDAALIRDQIIKIKNVAFSALSTGGKGVWALVKVSDPNNLDAHFQALRKDFEHFGIILDRTKGRNSNDARFYSYDPNAKVNREFEIYTKKYSIQPRKPAAKVHKSNRSTYGETALKQEIGELALAREGSRNETLFKAAASLFELVAGGELSMMETESSLMETAQQIGLSRSEARATINSAKQTGMQNPRSGNKKPALRGVGKKRESTSEFPNSKKKSEDEFNSALQNDPILQSIVNKFDAVPIFDN